MMFRINIILMLITIIPDLDCCSSFRVFNGKSIHMYSSAGGLEVSIHKSMKFKRSQYILKQQQQQQQQKNDSQSLPAIPSAESTWHKYFQFFYINRKSNSSAKLNESLKIDVPDEDEEEQLHDDYSSSISIITETSELTTSTPSVSASTSTSTLALASASHQNQQEDDVPLNLISEIVSLECVDVLKLEFCLNGGRCFLYPILNHSLSSCECAEGFVGERCEAKSYEFIPRIRPRLVLAKTKGGPLVYGLAVLDILFLLFLFCKNYIRE